MAAKSSVKILADENISIHLIKILHMVGVRTAYPFDKEEPGGQFPKATPDEEWIPQADARGFVCLTQDRKTLRQSHIAQVICESGARMIFLPAKWGDAGLRMQLLWSLKYWPKLEERAATMKPGECVKVLMNGRIIAINEEDRRPLANPSSHLRT